MSTTLATVQPMPDAQLVERAIVQGDLERLQPHERTVYYLRLCESLGLNPLTRPFEYVKLSGKLTLYARRDCADQLRKLQEISVQITGREERDDGLYVVYARATSPKGRTDEASGVVALGNLQGEARANALMKAETKAKRRVTLSICGLGWMDETEVADVHEARPIPARQVEHQPVGLSAADLAAKAKSATAPDAAEEVLRVAKQPGIRAHAYASLVRLALDPADAREVATRVREDAALPEEIRQKLFAAIDQRVAALEDADRDGSAPDSGVEHDVSQAEVS